MRLATRSTVSLLLVLGAYAQSPTSGPCRVAGNPPIAYDCVVTTVLGIGPPGFGDGGSATQAQFALPTGVLPAPDGSVLVVDTNGHKIRRFRVGGTIETIAGVGSSDNRDIRDGGLATNAQLRYPGAIEFGPDGSLYIADTRYYRIRRVGLDGIIQTVAGNGSIFTNPAQSGMRATDAGISGPDGIAFDSTGRLYISESDRFRVWRVAKDGTLELVAGNGQFGKTGDGGPATTASLDNHMLAIWQNFLFIGGDSAVRRVDLDTGIITSVPGARGNYIRLNSNGDLYFSGGCAVYRRDNLSGSVGIVAGINSCTFSGDGGAATKASVNSVYGIGLDASGDLYLADAGNLRIRRVHSGIIESIAGGGITTVPANVPASSAVVFDGQGLAVDRVGNIFFADINNNLIRRLDKTGNVRIVAGGGTSISDGAHPLQTNVNGGGGLKFDSRGNLLFIDQSDQSTIRMITPGADGVIDDSADEQVVTIAGRNSPHTPDRGKADGGPAKEAIFDAIRGFDLDSSGNLWVADWRDSRIRRITTGSDGVVNGGSDEIISTIFGTGDARYAGDCGPAIKASLTRPGAFSLAISPDDTVYVGDETGRLRRIDARTHTVSTFTRTDDIGGGTSMLFDKAGRLLIGMGSTSIYDIDPTSGFRTLVAGGSEHGFQGDGGDARQATFQGIRAFAWNQEGELLFLDDGNFRIRRVTFVPRGAAATLQGPSFGPTSLVSSASLCQGPVSPGTLVSLFGSGLGPEQLTVASPKNGQFPTSLAGVQVLVQGKAVPLLYAADSQIGFVMPWNGYSIPQDPYGWQASLRVDYQGKQSATVTAFAQAASPGIFAANGGGRGPGAILNQDGTLNSVSAPAARGSVVVLYATGLGTLSPTPTDGAVTGSVLPKPMLPITVTVGGLDAEILFVGSAPTLISGVLQLNLRVPATGQSGANEVQITAGGVSSQTGLTLMISK